MYHKLIFIALSTIISALTLSADNSHDKTDAHSSWTGLWFPENPDQISKDQTVVDDETLQMAESRSNEDWKGLWFPGPPGQSIPTTFGNVNDSQLPAMGISELNCDDGRTNLALDYDPRNISHHSRHLCTDEKRLFAPSYDTKPKLLDYTIPPEYTALHKCMNEEIEYNDVIPTFGSHRKLWPVYGEYVYVPPQRWIHSLEHGAIVLLYHPCVNLNQLDIVRSLIKKCLYRHVITAYDLLDPERPFALVAWGRSLEFSVADQVVIVGFIRLYGLQGPERVFSDGQYNQALIEQSNIVTTPDDSVLCQNV